MGEILYYQSAHDNDGLYHHGVKGMRWGVRRYQNEDGSLTPAGKKHAKTADGEADERSKRSSGRGIAVYDAFKKAYGGVKFYEMDAKERESFTAEYEKTRATLAKQWKNAKSKAEKERIRDIVDDLEEGYLNIVEED